MSEIQKREETSSSDESGCLFIIIIFGASSMYPVSILLSFAILFAGVGLIAFPRYKDYQLKKLKMQQEHEMRMLQQRIE